MRSGEAGGRPVRGGEGGRGRPSSGDEASVRPDRGQRPAPRPWPPRSQSSTGSRTGERPSCCHGQTFFSDPSRLMILNLTIDYHPPGSHCQAPHR